MYNMILQFLTNYIVIISNWDIYVDKTFGVKSCKNNSLPRILWKEEFHQCLTPIDMKSYLFKKFTRITQYLSLSYNLSLHHVV